MVRAAWTERCVREGYGLASVAEYLGIEFRHHDAGEDARVRAEIVLAACTSTPKRRIFEVVTRRYLSLPVLITTNKPFSEWADVFSSAACVVTLVDRLIHRFEIVQLDGESYRLREAKEQAAKCSKARSRRSAKSRASRLATIGTLSPEHRCRLPPHCPQSVQYTRPDPPSTAMRTGLPTPRVTKSSTPEPSRLARRIDRAAESCQ